jgi:putative MATE family efflux protein
MSSTDVVAVFTQGSLMRHVAVMSFTSSIGLMAIFAVDLVDMIFISMLGRDALAAAAGYASTLLFFTNSIAMGLSIAAGALVARALGAGKKTEAREYATSVALFAAMTGCVLPIIILPNLTVLLHLLGATGDVADQAASYIWIIMPSMAVIGVAMTAMAVLRAYGDARRSMYATLFGGLANAVFDPIFIFLFALDLQGAAIASVIARFVMLFAAMRPAIQRHDAFARPSFAVLKRDLSTVSSLAGPAVLTNVATPFGAAILTREMSKYGSDAVAGMAVIGRLTPVAFAVVLALSGAIGPIIGQNFGAGLTDRVRRAFTDSLKFIAVYVFGVTVILFLLRMPIADLFGATGQARTLIYLFCGPLALIFFFTGATFAANATFNNLGHPLYSTWINWGKNTLGLVPFVMLGAALWGAPGILIGQGVGAIFSALIAIALALKVIEAPAVKHVQQPFLKSRRNHVLFHHGRW